MGKKIVNASGVSFIIPTLNTERTIRKCLSCISIQDYPKSKIEVLILDGGSTDRTIPIVKTFKNINVRIIHAGHKDNQEARRMVGFKKARYDLICILDSDNYLGSKDWVSRMVKPMIDCPNLIGSFTLHYHYDPRQTPFNRYVALFGGHDPVSYYLNKTDRLKWTDQTWVRTEQILSHNSRYLVVKFDSNDFPTLGSNGSIIRKKLVDLHELTPEMFFHTDILYDLLSKNYNKYAVVDVPLIHDTHSTLLRNIKKRVEYMSLHHVKLAKLRRYKVFNSQSPKDIFNLIKFILFTVTVVEPLSESIVGFVKVPDLAWFMHPMACWYFLVGYSLSVLKSK